MSSKRYPEEFKIEAVRQVTDRGYSVAESFFQLLKRERVRRKIYNTRDEARADLFDYIEVFYNRQRRHSANEHLSPVDYEQQYQKRLNRV